MPAAVMCSYILVEGLWDELPFTVDAGVRALTGDLLLLLWDAARRRGCPTCVQGTWVRRNSREHKERLMKR